jgi:hypothetical protein
MINIAFLTTLGLKKENTNIELCNSCIGSNHKVRPLKSLYTYFLLSEKSYGEKEEESIKT